MIRARGLTKSFKQRRQTTTAVDHVDFDIDEGEFVAYVGPNGAGKSTTIKMMCGVLVPSAGEVLVDGLVPWQQRRTLAERMGVVFGQRTQLWWDLPLRESFRLVGRLYRIPRAEVADRLDELSAVLDLDPLMNVPVRALSLGQRMRGELAAAVLPRPRVLFLDEPTIGLDVEAKASVREFLAKMNRDTGMTAVLTTHDLGDIVQLCRRMLIIDHGHVIYDGSVDGLKERYAPGRQLMIDVLDDGPVSAPGATPLRSEGHRHWFHVPPDERVADVVGSLLARYEVEDLTLEEPDIEQIIRRIYREGRTLTDEDR